MKKYILPFRPSPEIKRTPAPLHRKFKAFHAIDWGMPVGTPILAARDGTIIFTESRFNSRGGCAKYRYRSNFVEILHADGEFSLYGHFKWRGVRAKKGQKVKAGQLIGYSGQTGYATYPHLHFAVYGAIDGKNIRMGFK